MSSLDYECNSKLFAFFHNSFFFVKGFLPPATESDVIVINLLFELLTS